jgi:hypothetical protein
MFRMSLKKRLLAQSGSAIVMIMVAGAAIAGAGVYMMTMSQNVEKGIRSISNREKYTNLNTLLTTGLEDSIVCTAALSGKDITNAWTPNGVSLTPFSINLLGTTQNINSTWRSPESLKISDIRLFVTEADLRTGLRRDIATSPFLKAVNATVKITATKGTPALGMAKNDHFIPKLMLYYETVGTQNILYACFSSKGEGALCTLGEGIFNSYAVVGSRPRCEPYGKCLLDDQGLINSSGTCTAPYLRVRVSPNRYICQWCNQHWSP